MIIMMNDLYECVTYIKFLHKICQNQTNNKYNSKTNLTPTNLHHNPPHQTMHTSSPQSSIESQLLTFSQQPEPSKAQYKGSTLKDLFPSNYYEEMSLFFEQNKLYNPHFQFSTVVSHDVGELHQDYQQVANKILINNTFMASNQPSLTEEEVLAAINQYLQQIGLEDYVQVHFSTECLSRTSVIYYKNKIVLKLRLPVKHTKTSLEGTLNHEIGTHIVRYLNHKENSQRKPTKQSKVFEEGLAAINQLLPQQKPILFKAAVRYNAVIHASKSSFVDVYKYISKYIKDETDCWRETVRAKRGLMDTSKPGAYYKDQNYLIGALDILKNRKNIDFQSCFYSKLSAEEGKNIKQGVLPPFMETPAKRHAYISKIEAIALCNFAQEQ